MTSIVISSNDHELCRTIGEKTAESLGCTHLDQAFLEHVAEHFGVSRDKLEGALDPDATRRLRARTRSLLLGYISVMTLEELQKDAIVCTGLAAHLYVKDVSHVLMVCVLRDHKDLAARIIAKNHVSPRKAEKILERDRVRRTRWSMGHFGIDEQDPSNYDMVLNVKQIEVEKLVEMIADLAGYRKFDAMTYSNNRLNELKMASRVRVSLLPDYPDIKVRVAGTRAIIHARCPARVKRKVTTRIKETATQIDGIDSVEVHTENAISLVDKVRTTFSMS